MCIFRRRISAGGEALKNMVMPSSAKLTTDNKGVCANKLISMLLFISQPNVFPGYSLIIK